MILAGDIGGTKCNMGLFELRDGKLSAVRRDRFSSHSHASLEDVISKFLQGNAQGIQAAAFAIAGPVVHNHVQVTNLPWVVDAAALSQTFSIPHVRLLNDLEGTAYSLRILPASDFVTLREGVADPEGNQGLLAAGTGLGEALLVWDGHQHIASSSEGGHCDLAPRNTREIELLQFLRQRMEIVSVEAILSGRGFRELHTFLNPGLLHPGFDDPSVDWAPEITRQALAGSCPVCLQAVQFWMEIYGSEAGNLALKILARGGIFVAGGIATKTLPILRDGRFVQAFDRKEKMEKLLSTIPIRVVTNQEAPLLGAAWVASREIR